MDESFSKLLSIVGKKEKKLNFKNPLLKYILTDSDDDKKISDFAIKNTTINKDNYEFKLLIIPKEIPIKKENAKHLLDFEMKKVYAINLAIADNKSFCELTLDKFDSQIDASYKFTEWENYINNNDSITIVNKVIDNIK